MRAPRRPRDREPGGSAADFRDQALSCFRRSQQRRHSGMRLRSAIADLRRQARNPYSRWYGYGFRVRSLHSRPGMTIVDVDADRPSGRKSMTDLAATGGVPGPGRIGRVAIGDLVKRAAQRFPDRIAVTDGERRVSFTELKRDANRFANYLVGRGLKPGEKISTVCNNSGEFVKALFGIH